MGAKKKTYPWEKYIRFDEDGRVRVMNMTLFGRIKGKIDLDPNKELWIYRKKKTGPGGGEGKANAMCGCRRT